MVIGYSPSCLLQEGLYLRSLLKLPLRETLIPILRRYKHQRNRENFAYLVEAIAL
ncbi:MAG: hypothetical protein AAGA60_06205 [Cyanobacteria bacterium P01_E01_bin.42]